MRFTAIQWEAIPPAVRFAYARWMLVFPEYDINKTMGWECFEACADPGTVYAVNRSGHWYRANGTCQQLDNPVRCAPFEREYA